MCLVTQLGSICWGGGTSRGMNVPSAACGDLASPLASLPAVPPLSLFETPRREGETPALYWEKH